MTDKQNTVIELMKKLGSKGHVVARGDSVKVSLPFAEDVNPNITVWPNGAWRDFSGTDTAPKWEELGLLKHGYLEDLQHAVTNRFPRMWNELHDAFDQEHLDYVQRRNLRWESIKLFWGSLAFPIVDELNNIIGIQTRRIDGGEPKNIMVHGSDAKNGLFISHPIVTVDDSHSPLLICEGATDTYTKVFGVNQVGCISCSLLGGLKKYLSVQKGTYCEFILALDADEAGRTAQGELLAYMLSIGIPREKIFLMVHTDGNKDLNDEMCHNKHFDSVPINVKSDVHDIFVTVVDGVTNDDEASIEMKEALWVGFFPPDFPGHEHSTKPDGLHKLYVFPESYSRTEINRQMYNFKASAYILRGW